MKLFVSWDVALRISRLGRRIHAEELPIGAICMYCVTDVMTNTRLAGKLLCKV
jgi:hypothetical protein